MTPKPSTACIEWTGSKTNNGYGRVQRRKRSSSPLLIHRLTWEEANGPIPEGMVVMHTCDNRCCYNIEHLRLGSQGDNLRMAYERGMPPRGCAAHERR